MNQANNALEQAKLASEKVMSIINWTSEKYFDFQYETGLEYLEAYIPQDPMGIDKLQRSKTFWSWWRNQWFLRDQQFLIDSIMNVSLRYRVNIYEQLHNPRLLAQDIAINSIILEETYAVMIDEVHKIEGHI